MVERYYKPSIMMSTVDGSLKDLHEAFSGFDVYQALNRAKTRYPLSGGHKYAAGLTVELSEAGRIPRRIQEGGGRAS